MLWRQRRILQHSHSDATEKFGTPKKRNVYDNRLQIQTLVNVKLYSNCLFERDDRIQSRGNT